MESWSADRIGALGSNDGVSPEFDRLCRDGILFTKFYANGIRTNRGIPAILCSFASPPGRSIMKRYSADYPFESLAQVLNRFDYQSIFAYGGDVEFDNIRGFLKSLGYNEFYSEDNFSSEQILGKWGIPDHLLFNRMVTEIDSFKRPFNLTILGLSFHEPYLIPDNRFTFYGDTIPDADRLNCFYYTDWALGNFIDSIRNLPISDSTIFVITADHCPHQSTASPIDPVNFHIPLLIHAPGLNGEGDYIVDKTGSQVDIIPTLINYMGLNADYIGWGRNLIDLEETDPGYAVLITDRRWSLIQDTLLYINLVDTDNMFFNLNDPDYLQNNLLNNYKQQSENFEQRLNSYIQMSYKLSRGGGK
jgi:phosphoglycerol transferase MdoB-like AlkP superfamily enzyme